QHEPLCKHIILGVTPIASGVQIAEMKALLQPQADARERTRDLAGNERLSAHRRFVIEKDAVAGEHPVSLAIIHGDPVGVNLRRAVRRTGIKWSRLTLRYFPDIPEY